MEGGNTTNPNPIGVSEVYPLFRYFLCATFSKGDPPTISARLVVGYHITH